LEGYINASSASNLEWEIALTGKIELKKRRSNMTTELRSYVGGNWRDGARLVEDINPANPSEAVAQVSMSNASLAVAAVEAAFSAKLHPPPILFSIGRSREEGYGYD
jgi:hypothetical protein